MRVLSVASECAPLVKTGGLADVVGSLPAALAAEGVEMRVLLPAYRGLADRLEGAERIALDMGQGEGARLIAGEAAGLSLLLLDEPALYDRPGAPYTRADGTDWPDNALRFARLARAGAAIAARGVGGWRPEVLHAHDWQAGLAPLYLRVAEGGGPPCLMTIHNIAFQGLFPRSVLPALGLPETVFSVEAAEFWGQVGFLKAGLATAERISTVSPSYARELTTPEFGMGLEGLIGHRAGVLTGILNGIDTAAWDPEADPALAAPFSARRPGGKAANRRALAARFGLRPRRDGPLFIVVSRMTRQKGLDLLLDALPGLLAQGGCLAVLGSGERDLEAGFRAAAEAHAGRVGTVTGYDEPLSHLMQGGADAILVPSRFEPCGLTQLYALRYGTIPVVARTGGLADTVIDANAAALGAGVATGIQHAPGSVGALADGIARASGLFGTGHWARMRRNAMRQPVGWGEAAAAYAGLYRGMVAEALAA